jgi:hypothetical protein
MKTDVRQPFPTTADSTTATARGTMPAVFRPPRDGENLLHVTVGQAFQSVHASRVFQTN